MAGGELFGFDPGLERPEESYVLGFDPDLGRRGPAKGSVGSSLLDVGIEPVVLHYALSTIWPATMAPVSSNGGRLEYGSSSWDLWRDASLRSCPCMLVFRLEPPSPF